MQLFCRTKSILETYLISFLEMILTEVFSCQIQNFYGAYINLFTYRQLFCRIKSILENYLILFLEMKLTKATHINKTEVSDLSTCSTMKSFTGGYGSIN